MDNLFEDKSRSRKTLKLGFCIFLSATSSLESSVQMKRRRDPGAIFITSLLLLKFNKLRCTRLWNVSESIASIRLADKSSRSSFSKCWKVPESIVLIQLAYKSRCSSPTIDFAEIQLGQVMETVEAVWCEIGDVFFAQVAAPQTSENNASEEVGLD